MGVFSFFVEMSDLDKLHELCQKTYKQQAIWFLNAFWDTKESEAEKLWDYVQKLNELDLEHHEEGCALDEMKAHVFLEKFDETLTVREMRAKLRSTGAIGETERPKVVPLTHYLLYKYDVEWHKLVDETRQGSNKEEMEKAEKMLAEVQAAFRESEAKASVARQKLLEAQSAENAAKDREAAAKASEQAAKQREAEAKEAAEQAKKTEAQANQDAAAAKEREAEAKAAQQELEAALQELHAQEKAYNDKKAELQKKSEEGGVVSRNKAANELAQLLAEDPLPLRRAKITQEAAVKKAERATTAAASAREAAEKSASAASKARQESEAAANNATAAREQAEKDAQAASRAREAATSAAQASAAAKAEADAAVEAARQQLEAAEAFLEEVRSRPGQAFGALFWLDRELYEQRKYLPVSKGGIAK